MKRVNKLKQNWEFRRLYSRGKCVATAYFVMYFIKGRPGKVRLGITAGKKIGSAVKRNRAKRVLTAAFDNCMPDIKSGFDFCLVARGKILSSNSNDITLLLSEKLSENGLINI